MSRSNLCRMGLIFLLLAGAGLALPGCSKQGEGERCSPTANGSEDCEEGLICTDDGQSGSDFGRCCPPDGAPIGDSRCNFTPTTGSTGGASSGGASTGGNSGGGNSSGGNGSGDAGAPSSGEGGSGAMSSAGAGGNDDSGATGGAGGAG